MTTEVAENNSGKIIRPKKEWPERLRATLAVLFFIALVASLIVILKNDLVNKKIEETKSLVIDYIGAQGFTLDDVIITGRNRTTLDEINKVANLKRGDNILKINVNELKRNLETLPWVRMVRVKRSFLPNIIRIDIEEKNVLAIWQLNERFYPIDTDGYIIEADYRASKPMLLIVGAGAADNILSLLETIKELSPDFITRIKVANYISKRRWNIILDDIANGITIKLPEENFAAAWKKLLKLDAEKGILKRKLTIIDLRLEDKVTVKLKKTRAKQKVREHKI